MQKNLGRREFIGHTVFGMAAMAIPSWSLGSDKLFEIEVESSDITDYKITGTIRWLKDHFRKKIRPVIPDKLRELYNGTAMFALDLSDDPTLLSNIFEKIKSEGNFENVIKDPYYKDGQEDITFFNTVYRDYSLRGNFNNLEIELYFDTDREFTKINSMDFHINNLNLDKDRENHPDRIFKGTYIGDLFEEYGSQAPYLKIFTHLNGDEIDIGGLRTMFTRALNKQELIKKDFGLIRQHLGK